jgi:hypothetical protein
MYIFNFQIDTRLTQIRIFYGVHLVNIWAKIVEISFAIHVCSIVIYGYKHNTLVHIWTVAWYTYTLSIFWCMFSHCSNLYRIPLFYTNVSFKFVKFTFHIFTSIFAKFYYFHILTFLSLSPLIWLVHTLWRNSNLACLLGFRKLLIYSSNHSLCWSRSQWPGLSLVAIFKSYKVFSQALLISWLLSD